MSDAFIPVVDPTVGNHNDRLAGKKISRREERGIRENRSKSGKTLLKALGGNIFNLNFEKTRNL